MKKSKSNITKKQLFEFGLIIGCGLPIIFGFFIPFLNGHSFKTWTLVIGFPLIIISLINPLLLLRVYKGWMKLGFILGWINGRIILSLVFYLILLPISLLMKIFNYDPLMKKRNNKISYKINNQNHEIDLTRIF